MPLYHPRKPSAFAVFHRQSIGFLYKVPTILPFGPRTVGWLYIRVNAWTNRKTALRNHCTYLQCLQVALRGTGKIIANEQSQSGVRNQTTYNAHPRNGAAREKRPRAVGREYLAAHQEVFGEVVAR